MRVVTDAEQGAVFEPNARGTLDLDGQRLGGGAQPADFKVLAVERTILDLAAVVIRHELAARCAAQGAAGVGKWTAIRHARHHQVARTTVQRHREFPCREPRAIDDRLIIAGEKAGGIAQLSDSHGNEICLEKLPRRLRFEPPRLDRAGADLFERGAYGSGVARGALELRMSQSIVGRMEMRGLRAKCIGTDDRTATGIKGRKSAGVIVAGPAVEIAPTGGLQRGIGDFQWPDARINRRGSLWSGPLRRRPGVAGRRLRIMPRSGAGAR
jgi:hypothetical protein